MPSHQCPAASAHYAQDHLREPLDQRLLHTVCILSATVDNEPFLNPEVSMGRPFSTRLLPAYQVVSTGASALAFSLDYINVIIKAAASFSSSFGS